MSQSLDIDLCSRIYYSSYCTESLNNTQAITQARATHTHTQPLFENLNKKEKGF